MHLDIIKFKLNQLHVLNSSSMVYISSKDFVTKDFILKANVDRHLLGMRFFQVYF